MVGFSNVKVCCPFDIYISCDINFTIPMCFFPLSAFRGLTFHYITMKYLVTLLALLLTSVTSSATCTATEQHAYSGASSTSNIATVSVNVNAVGDLVVFTAMCYNKASLSSCQPVSVVMNGQMAVRTSVPGSPAIQETNGENGNNGSGWIYYIESAANSGIQTATFTTTGLLTNEQITYIDFSISTGCHATHHLDSALASSPGIASSGPRTHSPSLTDRGALMVNFTWISGHINDPVIAPFTCTAYTGGNQGGNPSAPTETCEFVTTVNAVGYILSAGAGAQTAGWNINQQGISWESLTTSFTLQPINPLPSPPTGLAAIVQ